MMGARLVNMAEESVTLSTEPEGMVLGYYR